jgi:hypothetical protein
MALNLSTLTSSATSGDVLAEALTTADFLENVPVLRNLARGSQKGGDAKQDVALNQPKALPLIDGKGYCYLPVTTGNAPAVTFPTIGANDNFVLEMVVYIVNVEDFHVVSGSNNHRILIYSPSGVPSFQYRDSSNNNNAALSGSLSAGLSTLRFEKTGSTLVFKQNGAIKGTINNITAAPTFTHLSFNGQFSTSRLPLNGYIQSVTLSIGGTEQLNIDFTATNVRHGDTKFKCATGQVVTINQSGNDPATIIKKSVLRFDGANSGLEGLFNQTITDGAYMFAAFSVLGDGGEPYTRVFQTINAANNTPVLFSSRYDSENSLYWYSSNNTWQKAHDGMYDDERGDILHELLFTSGLQKSRVNNADAYSATLSESNTEMFSYGIANNHPSDSLSAAIDLEFLALFPATITDAQADSVRSYINNRNNVFSLVDNGFYFFDPQKATFTGNFTGSNTLDGYITGSDLGDTDVRSNLTLVQGTLNDQPSTDGYTITFNDAAEHLEFVNGASQNLSGWQICGTSFGTFVYRVQGSVTELNLLGNAGVIRSVGDLYGIILLPASATGKDIEDARRILIDRGASDSVSASSVQQFWQSRNDIVEFKQVDTSSVTSFKEGWRFCASLEIFPPLQAPNCTNFLNAWQGTTALSSFPAGAKLGTSANNVNFTSAWQASGLTSFPALDLSTGTNFNQAFFQATSLEQFGQCDFSNASSFDLCWYYCSSLTTFPSMQLPSATSLNSTWMGCSSLTNFGKLEAPNVTVFRFTWSGSGITTIEDGTLLGTSASSVDFTSAFKNCTALTTLPSNLDLSKGDDFQTAFQNCQSLVDFPANAFDTMGTPQDYCFLNTWLDNNALSAASVENILVSINTSGQSAPSTGPEITIKYNTATGTPAYSTLASLKSKGWVIIVNGVTL